MNKCLFSSNYQCWETPYDLFNELDREFHFTLDACASSHNCKCKRYIDAETNFLQLFLCSEIIFCNPPYNMISDFVEHCSLLSAYNTIVMLVPARTDTKWFHTYIYNKDNVEIRFLKGRLKFTINGIKQNSAPFPSMVVIFKNKELN